MSEIPVITVDGPSGTGKGTVCSHLANWLAWNFLDSGALYRILAVAAEKYHLATDNEPVIAELAESLDVVFHRPRPGKNMTVIFEGCDISQKIRTLFFAYLHSVMWPPRPFHYLSNASP